MKKSFKSVGYALLAGLMLFSAGCSTGQAPETKKYTVTFSQDGFADVSYSVEEGASIAQKDIPATKPVEGYTVVWEEKSLTNIQKDITIEAIATPNDYTVTYLLDTEEGETLETGLTQTITYDSAYTLATPTLYGYTFAGWQLEDQTIVSQTGTQWKIAKDITVSATWSGNYYTLTFVDQNGVSTPVIVENGDTIQESQIPAIEQTKTGYELSWNVLDFSQITSNTNVSIKETAKTYTITYAATGDPIDGTTVELTYDALCSALNMSLTKEGYNFQGWKYGDALYTNETKWNIANDVTLVANWVEKDKVTVTFYNTDGSATAKTIYKGETLTDIPAIKTKEGYTVDTQNWYLDAACTQVASFANLQEGISVYAKATANKYVITYSVPEDASVNNTQEQVTYDADYTLKTPTRELYTFGGWTTADGKALPQTGKWTTVGNTTLTATWVANYYEITFVHLDNTVETIKVENGKTLSASAIPANQTKKGHTVAWTITDFTTVTGNTTVNEVATANTYTITYQLKSDESITGETTVTVTYGEEFTLAVPTNTDSTKKFNYWKNVLTGEKVVGGTWLYDTDITLEVKWDILDEEWTKNY